MANRILVPYGSYRSDRTGIRLANYIVTQLSAPGDDGAVVKVSFKKIVGCVAPWRRIDSPHATHPARLGSCSFFRKEHS